jgi:colicin import membrane protein
VERAQAEKKAAQEADALAGSLLADLDSFSSRQDEERKVNEEADRKARAEAERQAKEEQARREREEAERKARKAEERRRREEEEARQREEAEQREREEEARRKEAEAEKKKKERVMSARNKEVTDIPISSADLDRGDVEDDERKLSPEARKALRDREREVARARSRGDMSGKSAAAAYKRKQPTQWASRSRSSCFSCC